MKREREISSRVIAWSSGEISPPYECRLNFTNKCNLACLPCMSRGRPAYEPDKEITKNGYIRIIREAAEMGVRRFDICGGGEPFCREDAIFMMEEIKAHDLQGTISTNGTILTEDTIRRLVEFGWDEIRFSINGPDAETDDYLRGVKGAFDKTIKAIKFFSSIKEKTNKEKPNLIITPIITRFNYSKILEFVEMSNNLKVDSLILQPFMPEILEDFTGVDEEKRKNISEMLKLSDDDRREFRSSLKEAKRLADDYEINNNFESLTESSLKLSTAEIIQLGSRKQENKILSIPCYQPWWVLDISVDGGVGPCPRSDMRENIKDKKLSDVWYGEEFTIFRRMLASGKIPKICESCCTISTFDNQRIKEVIYHIVSSRG